MFGLKFDTSFSKPLNIEYLIYYSLDLRCNCEDKHFIILVGIVLFLILQNVAVSCVRGATQKFPKFECRSLTT
jgi:hypothetical protein